VAMTVLPDGRVLASSYLGPGASFTLLDLASGRSEGPLSVPYELNLGQAALVSPDQVLVAGTPTVVVAVDPLRVEPIAAPEKGWSRAAVALPEGVLVVGPQEAVYSEGRWTARAPLAGPRWGGSGVRAAGGRVVLAGRASTAEDQFSVDVYDPERDIWARVRPSWPAPVLAEARLARMREISARHGHVSEPAPTTAVWASPVAMADGSVVMFVDAAGEFTTSLATMAWLDPVGLAWSEAHRLPELVAQVGRAAVGLSDGRLVTTGWSRTASQERLFVWSRAEGWREGPSVAPDPGTPLGVLPDGRVLCVSEGALRPVAP
jgi:hypothetical protein